jgi:hypothetical protein
MPQYKYMIYRYLSRILEFRSRDISLIGDEPLKYRRQISETVKNEMVIIWLRINRSILRLKKEEYTKKGRHNMTSF